MEAIREEAALDAAGAAAARGLDGRYRPGTASAYRRRAFPRPPARAYSTSSGFSGVGVTIGPGSGAITVGESPGPLPRYAPTIVAGARLPPAAGETFGISRSGGGGIGVATQRASAAITSAGRLVPLGRVLRHHPVDDRGDLVGHVRARASGSAAAGGSGARSASGRPSPRGTAGCRSAGSRTSRRGSRCRRGCRRVWLSSACSGAR